MTSTADTDLTETVLDGRLERTGELTLESPAFDDGGSLPDYTGYVNENENPPLSIGGVSEECESLVLVMDHPDAAPIAGHVWDHWLVWDIDPDIGQIPRGWEPADATVGTNHYLERGYGGPSPPEGSHDYHFTLLALDDTLDAPSSTGKARLCSLLTLEGVGEPIASEASVLAATELVGTYAADQGTLF